MALAWNIFKFPKLSKEITNTSIYSNIQNSYLFLSVRKKHWNPKWKWLRKQKVQPVDLPNFHRDTKSQTEKMRERMKELGIEPPRYWRSRPMTITNSSQVIDPYIPPEGDGKSTFLSKKGTIELASSLNKKRLTRNAISNIKRFDVDFDALLFPQEAHDIYVKAHTVLMNKNEEELSKYATELAVSQMIGGLKHKTIRWKFIESLEAPIVVHVSSAPIIVESNIFGQVTVRFHTKQSLAIYDRFGRLYHGSEIVAKDVLEYVVFEKQVCNLYGTWKLHAKIIPEWMPASPPVAKTFRVEEIEKDELDEFIEEDQTSEYTAESEIVKESKSEIMQK